jgi:hypothetical protein
MESKLFKMKTSKASRWPIPPVCRSLSRFVSCPVLCFSPRCHVVKVGTAVTLAVCSSPSSSSSSALETWRHESIINKFWTEVKLRGLLKNFYALSSLRMPVLEDV